MVLNRGAHRPRHDLPGGTWTVEVSPMNSTWDPDVESHLPACSRTPTYGASSRTSGGRPASTAAPQARSPTPGAAGTSTSTAPRRPSRPPRPPPSPRAPPPPPLRPGPRGGPMRAPEPPRPWPTTPLPRPRRRSGGPRIRMPRWRRGRRRRRLLRSPTRRRASWPTAGRFG